MLSITRLVGVVLIVVGVVSYWGTGRVSMTALIPAFFGAVFVVLALLATRDAARRHAMHAAVAFALVALLGTLPRLVPALTSGQIARPAVLAQLAMTLALLAYIVLGIRSFIAARRSREP